ncbi:putative Cation transporter/ATPase, N-terminus [Blattamonas nauphoetae]|uniref:Cation transporter/ATPase, N-terminus n=1 Tax=Blattamonas nauphoetae TaxID=2049346 RepID=A0ABQ9YBW9_9EUKA|nr:putative Cation transporter/ATPase, N-terminus [Blattamonas nauphoetae]
MNTEETHAVTNWHAVPVEDVCTSLQTHIEVGLSHEEARKRLERDGPNKLPDAKKTPAIIILLRQFHNPLIYLLIAVMIFCFVLQDWVCV